MRILWLVPITASERAFAEANGVDALESEFERRQVRVSDPFRDSIV